MKDICEYHDEIKDALYEVRADMKWTGKIAKTLIAILTAILGVLIIQTVGFFKNINDMNLLAKSNSQHIQNLYEHDKIHDESIKQLWIKFGGLNNKDRK